MKHAIAWCLLMIKASVVTAEQAVVSTYVVGVEDTRYFPQYDHDGDQFIGFARELLDEFAHQQGIHFDYRILPINRLYQAFLVDKTVDFKYPDDPQWRPELRAGLPIIYSKTCAEYIDGVMVLPERKATVRSRLKVLGIVRGFTPLHFEDTIARGELRLDENGSMTGLLTVALRGRVDGAYMNVDVARYQLRHVLRRPDGLVFDQALPHHRGGYTLATLRYPERIEAFNQFLQSNAHWIAAVKQRYQLSVE